MQNNITKNRVLDYYETYRNDVLPIFNDFECVRINILNEFKKKSFLKYLLPIIILAILGLISYPITFSQDASLSSKAVGGVIISIILMINALIFMPFFYYSAKKKENIKFTGMMKIKTLQPLLKVFGNIKWIGHDVTKENLNDVILKNEELDRSGLFISYNTRYTDDEFVGSYKDVPFKISETRMLSIHGSGKSRRCICAFEGVILTFNFNKKICNRTIVATKGDLTKKSQPLVVMAFVATFCLGFFEEGYAHWKLVLSIILLVGSYFTVKYFEKNEEALDEVKLEDPKFAKQFNVYSSDQVEARYLVTPSFMERFYNLKTVFGAKNAKCSFYGNTLMIAIQTKKNLFEICNLFKSLQEPSSINEFYSELDAIYKIIDYFKLDEKTGL